MAIQRDFVFNTNFVGIVSFLEVKMAKRLNDINYLLQKEEFLNNNPFFDAHEALFEGVKILSKTNKQTQTCPSLLLIIDICEHIENVGKTEKNVALLLNSIQECLIDTKNDISIAKEIVYILHIFNIDNIYI